MMGFIYDDEPVLGRVKFTYASLTPERLYRSDGPAVSEAPLPE